MQTLSDLGAAGAPNAITMNVLGLNLFSLPTVAFTFRLHRGKGEGQGTRIRPALVTDLTGLRDDVAKKTVWEDNPSQQILE